MNSRQERGETEPGRATVRNLGTEIRANPRLRPFLVPAGRLVTRIRTSSWPGLLVGAESWKSSDPAQAGPENVSDWELGLAGGLGFEPRQAESESAVLPLDDPPKWVKTRSGPPV